MGINSAYSIGNTALRANQVALETVGNNIANAATPNYSRQQVTLVPGRSAATWLNVGTGVRVQQIARRYDAAVESRLRAALADAESRRLQSQTLARIESLYNETTDADLSTALTGFFNSFGELANNPQDLGIRTIVVEKTRQLVTMISHLRSGLDGVRREVDGAIRTGVNEINRLASEIADLNRLVTLAEQGNLGSAPGLRDERDARLRELSGLIGIRIVEQDSGAVNVIIGNQALVDGRTYRTLTTATVEDRNLGISQVCFADNDEALALTGGALQGLVYSRDQWLGQQIDSLDQLARALIFEVNSLHAEGIGTTQARTLRSEKFVLDPAAALNSAASGLKNSPTNGSFLVHVTNVVSGMVETVLVNVDLDGLGADDSLNGIAAKLDAIDNVTAYVDASGRLVVEGSSSEIRVSFGEDSSRLLAALGVNGLFTGYDSVTIGLSADVAADPRLLAAGLSGENGDNANALRLAALADTPLAALADANLLDFHKQATTRMAVSAAAARSADVAADAFLAAMSDERESISGVNLDEEAVDLIRYQKAYTAAAKFMSALADLLDAVMDI